MRDVVFLVVITLAGGLAGFFANRAAYWRGEAARWKRATLHLQWELHHQYKLEMGSIHPDWVPCDECAQIVHWDVGRPP